MRTKPLAHNFPRRNRILSGLAIAVVVVEASLKSGSLITAYQALEAGRDVFAMPGSLYNPEVKGCHQLIREGAILVDEVSQLVSEAGGTEEKQVLANMQVQGDAALVLDCIDHEITTLSSIFARSQLTAQRIYPILLKLELSGFIVAGPGGYMQLY